MKTEFPYVNEYGLRVRYVSVHDDNAAEEDTNAMSPEQTGAKGKPPTRHQIIHAYHLAVASALQLNGGDRIKANAAVQREQPLLHEMYLRATNPHSTAFDPLR